MKRSITIVLIIVILINTVFPNFIYASEYGTFKDIQEHQKDGANMLNKLWEEGKTILSPDKGSRTENIKESKISSNLAANVLTGVIVAFFPQAFNALMTIVVISTQEDGYSSILQFDKASDNMGFTIENLVLGKYTLFDINFFEFNTQSEKNVSSTIKQNVAKWYYILRNICIVISLLVLIYVGIRMAISTVASEQAKYKKMLINWVTSFILVFVMQYIFIFLMELQQSLLQIVALWTDGMGFEEAITEIIKVLLKTNMGWNCYVVVIEYCMLVYYQVKFFIVYFKRVLEVGFLITISPLVTITYPIDKIGDGSAQSYKAWLTRIIYNIFIQLVHAIVYVVFIFSAAEIAKKVPIVGIIFLSALSRTEKIIKTTFSLKGKGLAEEKLLDKLKKG